MFTTIFYQPILNLLFFIYNLIPGHDIGVAVIVLTIFIKAVLWPLSAKAIKAQKAMQSLQPKLAALKQRYSKPEEKPELTKAMMELYKEEKINPLSSCLPLLIQLPFFWAIFRVFSDEFGGKASGLIYPFIFNPGALNAIAFGFLDFSKPNWVLAVLAGLSQFLQAKMMPKQTPAVKTQGSRDENMAAIMNKQMTYIFPALTIFICLSLPSGLAFYWFITTILTIVQQVMIFKKQPTSKIIEGEIIK